jgi:DNA-binding NarL/FixJ family response regulator
MKANGNDTIRAEVLTEEESVVPAAGADLQDRPSSMSPQKLAVARQLHEGRQHTVAAIAEMLGVSRATIYRHLGSAPPPATPVSSPRKRRR